MTSSATGSRTEWVRIRDRSHSSAYNFGAELLLIRLRSTIRMVRLLTSAPNHVAFGSEAGYRTIRRQRSAPNQPQFGTEDYHREVRQITSGPNDLIFGSEVMHRNSSVHHFGT